jgi:hypothetical protein
MGSGLSYTIGGKGRESIDINIPGPGYYDPKDYLSKDTIPATIISKSKRGDIVSRESIEKPGPGNYYNEKEFGKDA